MPRFKVRPAEIEDALDIARIHIESWRTTYAGIVEGRFLSELSVDQRRGWWENAIRESGGENIAVFVGEASLPETQAHETKAVGFVSGGPNRTNGTEFSSELYAIYILKDYQQFGLGRRLVHAVCDWLLARGHRTLMVWVLALNPSRRFYEKLEGQYLWSKRVNIGGQSLEEVAYGWKDLKSLARTTQI